MKTLVVGGTGLLGGHAALHLKAHGFDVTIASRTAPKAPLLAALPFISIDYTKATAPSVLKGFDALLFCAGQDIRHVDLGQSLDEQWHERNTVAIPRFFAAARDAGMRRAVLLGSFYPQMAPELIETIPYVRSRHLSDVGVRALNSARFEVVSVNAPFMVGHVPGLPNPMFEAYVAYAKGQLPDVPVFGPKGGTNFMSVGALSEALHQALLKGTPGKAYLVGDENLSFAEYFSLFFEAVGNPQPVPELDQEHPLLPDVAIYTGRGNYARYEPDMSLAYRRNDVKAAVRALVEQINA
ncbi:NAD-dependent epimerase/dehydratase family protein [Thauera sp.]